MTKSIHALSASAVRDFCTLCDRAHECWLNHLELFDNNPRNPELMKSSAGKELERLSKISQEYGLLQIVKLHEKGNDTLGINYVLTRGVWSDSVRPRLEALAQELGDLADKLRAVRNK